MKFCPKVHVSILSNLIQPWLTQLNLAVLDLKGLFKIDRFLNAVFFYIMLHHSYMSIELTVINLLTLFPSKKTYSQYRNPLLSEHCLLATFNIGSITTYLIWRGIWEGNRLEKRVGECKKKIKQELI